MIPASDGVKVPARIYRPKDMKAQPNGAAVIFVHGAGYLHNVHNYWSSYSREYMFNQYPRVEGLRRARHRLSRLGRLRTRLAHGDLPVDGRARSAGRSRRLEVSARKSSASIPKRIGMYGGSYGGFMTLMALFTEPTHFGAGAALRSVTDWAHYNHGYTARILNMPEEDTLAYRRSSPIFFAEGLEDPLLMVHGMVDTNVHFQDIVRLTQRLIELGKTDWDLAVYPVEDHGFVRTRRGRTSTAGSSSCSSERSPIHAMQAPRTEPAAASARARASSRARSRVRCGTIIGAPDYARYLAHQRAKHPDATPLSREEFVRERVRARYEGTGSRCC